MGLDHIDMVFQLEHRFAIKLQYEPFLQVRTVAGVRDVVAEQLSISNSDLSAMTTFNRLRRHLVGRCGCCRDDVRLSASMADLLRKN